MPNVLILNSKSIEIDNFEAQQTQEGQTVFYVSRTADANSPGIYNALGVTEPTIGLNSGSGSMGFTITNGVIFNYKYGSEGENASKEFFQIRGESIAMAPVSDHRS